MPKVLGIDPVNDDEDEIAEKTLKVALTTTIYKEDVRLTISESSKATPCKNTGPRPVGGGGSGGGIGGGQFSRGPKMGGGFGGPRKPI